LGLRRVSNGWKINRLDGLRVVRPRPSPPSFGQAAMPHRNCLIHHDILNVAGVVEGEAESRRLN
jgi:hypothetical protein